jgi:hypothetical protein
MLLSGGIGAILGALEPLGMRFIPLGSEFKGALYINFIFVIIFVVIYLSVKCQFFVNERSIFAVT